MQTDPKEAPGRARPRWTQRSRRAFAHAPMLAARLVFFTGLFALSGVLYVRLFLPDANEWIGAVYAAFCGMPLLLFKQGLLLRAIDRKLHGLPTPAYLLASLILDFLLIGVGYAACGVLLESFDLINDPLGELLLLPLNVFLYAFVWSTATNFLLRVRELLGRDGFSSMLISRYRNPLQEDRIFLFLDLVGSTAYAEANGDLKTQEYLAALFASISEPIRRNQGAIHDYIGDAAIVTWPRAKGVADARCIRCVVDILDSIEKDAEKWLSRYGEVPRLRAALHCGHVVTAEIGVDYHKITYFGDTINTTARLEGLCKSLSRPILISRDLSSQITLPNGVKLDDLGEHLLKGRSQPLGISAVILPACA